MSNESSSDVSLIEFALDTALEGGGASPMATALAIVVATIEQFSSAQSCGALRTAVLAFESRTVAFAVDATGRVHAGASAPGHTVVPGGLLAHVRRSVEDRVADEREASTRDEGKERSDGGIGGSGGLRPTEGRDGPSLPTRVVGGEG